MPDILAVWSVPEANTEVFEWMMHQRRDIRCYHEPFGQAWHQGESPLKPTYQKGDLTIEGLSLDSVLLALEHQSHNNTLFIKELPHVLSTVFNTEVLTLFNRSFFIRDPAKTILAKRADGEPIDDKSLGFEELRELFDRILLATSCPSPVVDYDALMEDPPGIVEQWCNTVGLGFEPDALSCPDTPSHTSPWWRDQAKLAQVQADGGLTPAPQEPINLADLPSDATGAYLRAKVHYDYLSQYRLKG